MLTQNVAFVLSFKEGGKRTFTRQLLDLGNDDEVKWIARQYLETNETNGCTKVEAFKLPEKPIATAI